MSGASWGAAPSSMPIFGQHKATARRAAQQRTCRAAWLRNVRQIVAKRCEKRRRFTKNLRIAIANPGMPVLFCCHACRAIGLQISRRGVGKSREWRRSLDNSATHEDHRLPGHAITYLRHIVEHLGR